MKTPSRRCETRSFQGTCARRHAETSIAQTAWPGWAFGPFEFLGAAFPDEGEQVRTVWADRIWHDL